MSRIGTAVGMGAVMVGLRAAPAPAQSRFFPRVPSVELPLAAPRARALVGRVLAVSRGESRFGRGSEAEAGIGEQFPLLTVVRGAHPFVVGFGTEVYGRFSLSDAKTSFISSDWLVGLTATLYGGPWEATLELSHESSHLGDEYADRFGADRIDWTRETVAGWLSYRRSAWRVSGTVSYAVVDELRLDPAAVGLGLDYRRPSPSRASLRPLAGIYLDAAGQTAWRVGASGRAGVGLRSAGSGREMAVSLIAHDGLSTQRQFYRRESRYVGLELRFDL